MIPRKATKGICCHKSEAQGQRVGGRGGGGSGLRDSFSRFLGVLHQQLEANSHQGERKGMGRGQPKQNSGSRICIINRGVP